MTPEEIKILSESMVEAVKMSTANSLSYIKAGFEGFKKLKIPMLRPDGQTDIKHPYADDKTIRLFVDFMVTYFDEAIKEIDKQSKVKKE